MHGANAAFLTSALLVLAGLPLAGCSTIYIHDSSLADKWKPTGEAFASAQYLKIYDNELKRMSDFATSEDASIARQGVARRDADVTSVLSGLTPAECAKLKPTVCASRKDALASVIKTDLAELLGPNPEIKKASLLGTVIRSDEQDILDYDYLADRERVLYQASLPPIVRPPATPRSKKQSGVAPPTAGGGGATAIDTSCKGLEKIGDGGLGDPHLKNALRYCQGAENAGQAVFETIAATTGHAGEAEATLCRGDVHSDLLTAYCDWRQAARLSSEAGGAAMTNALEQTLKKELDAADSANGQAQQSLRDFGEALQQALDSSGPGGEALTAAGKVKALSGLTEVIDAILRADICSATSQFDKAAVDAAKCASVGSPTEQKADAAWAFLSALAALTDATKAQARSVQWIAAAKAIVAAQKADAQLTLQSDQAEADALKRRFNALLIATTAEAQASLTLDGKSSVREVASAPDPADRICVGDDVNCALPLFVDARNRGTIPAEVLADRRDQLTREYGIRRERAAAERESLLIQAAAAQMQAYVDGGIDPGLIVRILGDAGLISAVAAK